MSLLDKLIEKAGEEVHDPENHREWSEKGFDEAVSEGRKLLDEKLGDPGLILVRNTADAALDKIEKHKDSFVTLGASGLRATIALLAQGRLDDAAHEAALIQLRTSANWDEVSAAITGAAESGDQARRDFETSKSDVLEVLKDVGVTAAKALLPLLLAVI